MTALVFPDPDVTNPWDDPNGETWWHNDHMWHRYSELSNEKLVAITPTTYDATSGVLETWASHETPTDSQITFVNSTGIATIGVAGWYRITTYVHWAGTGNNNWYGVDVDVEGSGTLIGSVLWANTWPASSGAAVAATFIAELAVDDEISLAWNAVGSQINPDGGQLAIELIGATFA